MSSLICGFHVQPASQIDYVLLFGKKMIISAKGICDKVNDDLVHSDLDRQHFVPLRRKIALEGHNNMGSI